MLTTYIAYEDDFCSWELFDFIYGLGLIKISSVRSIFCAVRTRISSTG